MSRSLLLLCFCCLACAEGDDKTPLDTAVDSDAADSDAVDTEPGKDCPDADGDGARCDDCDDADPLRAPGAPERCNGLDDDCDGRVVDEDPMGEVWSCTACDLGGYWQDTLAGGGSSQLEARLAQTARAFSVCEYTRARQFMFTTLDNDDGWVEGVYTGVRVFVGNREPDFEVMNAEHTWPGSDGGRDGIAECDLHHLFPADADANNRRGNYPFGEIAGEVLWEQGGSRLGLDAQRDTVFEPREQHKGNVARAMLYMALRHDLPEDTLRLAVLRAWHAADPPDAAEVERSLQIKDRQRNANPFVVCPATVQALVPPSSEEG